MKYLLTSTLFALCLPSELDAQNTILVKDCWPGELHGSDPDFIGTLEGKVLFSAQDEDHGREPWISDGTEQGTYMLADINTTSPFAGSSPMTGCEYNGYFYFFASTETQEAPDLWRTDGTSTGSELFLDVLPGQGDLFLEPEGPFFVEFADRLYFVDIGPDGDGVLRLWSTDGTEAGTLVSAPIANPMIESHSAAVWNDRLYLGADGQIFGDGLYALDQSGMLDTLVLLPENLASISDLTPSANGVYFLVSYSASERELWITDGTVAGTHPLTDIDGQGPDPGGVVREGKLFFSAHSAMHGKEPWCSDGSVAGTYQIADLIPGAETSSPDGFVDFGEAVYFTANSIDFPGETGLWRTNGAVDDCQRTDGAYGLRLISKFQNALICLGGDNQLLASDGSQDGLSSLASDTASLCCVSVWSASPGDAGLFLNAHSVDFNTELFLLTDVVAIDEPEDLISPIAFPMPFGDLLEVVLPTNGEYDVDVMDPLGNLILSAEKRSGHLSFDTSRLSVGVYFLRARSGLSVVIHRIVKG